MFVVYDGHKQFCNELFLLCFQLLRRGPLLSHLGRVNRLLNGPTEDDNDDDDEEGTPVNDPYKIEKLFCFLSPGVDFTSILRTAFSR